MKTHDHVKKKFHKYDAAPGPQSQRRAHVCVLNRYSLPVPELRWSGERERALLALAALLPSPKGRERYSRTLGVTPPLLDLACPLPAFSANHLRSGSDTQEASMSPRNLTSAPLSPVPNYSIIIHDDSGPFGGLFPHNFPPISPWR